MEQITKGGPKDWNTYNYVGFMFHAYDAALVNILQGNIIWVPAVETYFGHSFRGPWNEKED